MLFRSDTSVAAAAAGMAVRFDADVPEFSRSAIRTSQRLAVNENPAADARPERDHEPIVNALRGSEPMFTDSRRGGVILEHHGQI